MGRNNNRNTQPTGLDDEATQRRLAELRDELGNGQNQAIPQPEVIIPTAIDGVPYTDTTVDVLELLAGDDETDIELSEEEIARHQAVFLLPHLARLEAHVEADHVAYKENPKNNTKKWSSVRARRAALKKAGLYTDEVLREMTPSQIGLLFRATNELNKAPREANRDVSRGTETTSLSQEASDALDRLTRIYGTSQQALPKQAPKNDPSQPTSGKLSQAQLDRLASAFHAWGSGTDERDSIAKDNARRRAAASAPADSTATLPRARPASRVKTETKANQYKDVADIVTFDAHNRAHHSRHTSGRRGFMSNLDLASIANWQDEIRAGLTEREQENKDEYLRKKAERRVHTTPSKANSIDAAILQGETEIFGSAITDMDQYNSLVSNVERTRDVFAKLEAQRQSRAGDYFGMSRAYEDAREAYFAARIQLGQCALADDIANAPDDTAKNALAINYFIEEDNYLRVLTNEYTQKRPLKKFKNWLHEGSRLKRFSKFALLGAVGAGVTVAAGFAATAAAGAAVGAGVGSVFAAGTRFARGFTSRNAQGMEIYEEQVRDDHLLDEIEQRIHLLGAAGDIGNTSNVFAAYFHQDAEQEQKKVRHDVYRGAAFMGAGALIGASVHFGIDHWKGSNIVQSTTPNSGGGSGTPQHG
jgi:hypothetical protein